MMRDIAEENVFHFYNTIGWKTENGVTEDARRWEDLRECAREYVSKARLRVSKYIPHEGEYMLDMASGPIQFEEYVSYSRGFKKRYCVDLSAEALETAKTVIGDHGIFLCGSWFDIPLDDNMFDCTLSLHTIYHMHKDRQEEAVAKLLRVTRPGKPVIIVYSNPRTLSNLCKAPFRLLWRLVRSWRAEAEQSGPYFYTHPISWWNRFAEIADVKIVPWRALSSKDQKRLIPNNKLGKKMFAVLFELEERYPDFFVRHFEYPMIILAKKN